MVRYLRDGALRVANTPYSLIYLQFNLLSETFKNLKQYKNKNKSCRVCIAFGIQEKAIAVTHQLINILGDGVLFGRWYVI